VADTAPVGPTLEKIFPTPMPGYCCQRTHFCDCCRNMGIFLYGVERTKAFCECSFELHLQQAEKDKKMLTLLPLG